jgi:hypothetical protein
VLGIPVLAEESLPLLLWHIPQLNTIHKVNLDPNIYISMLLHLPAWMMKKVIIFGDMNRRFYEGSSYPSPKCSPIDEAEVNHFLTPLSW